MSQKPKLWIIHDKGETYALCSMCVLHRRLEPFVDYTPAPEAAEAVITAQGGKCRAEIEDYPDCRSTRGRSD
jgi:hypothetical protein